VVELRHLELVFEVGDRAQTLDHRSRPHLACELDQQVGEDPDLDVLQPVGGDRVFDEGDALFGGEQGGVLAHRLVDDADDDILEGA